MKIIDNEIIPVADVFEDLPPGTVFVYCGAYVIKASGGIAIDLQNGEVYRPMLDYVIGVTFPDAFLYLHGAPSV